jgi:hypothetical protein
VICLLDGRSKRQKVLSWISAKPKHPVTHSFFPVCEPPLEERHYHAGIQMVNLRDPQMHDVITGGFAWNGSRWNGSRLERVGTARVWHRLGGTEGNDDDHHELWSSRSGSYCKACVFPVGSLENSACLGIFKRILEKSPRVVTFAGGNVSCLLRVGLYAVSGRSLKDFISVASPEVDH